MLNIQIEGASSKAIRTLVAANLTTRGFTLGKFQRRRNTRSHIGLNRSSSTIGQGFISANDTLKLYGASANGEVRFIDNVTIGGTNFTIIAGDTVTINNSKTVTVIDANADVYTGFINGVPKTNYTGFGGNGSTTGTFGGAGAHNPQSIANAPPSHGHPSG